jgi:hypothetical protein
MNEKNINDLQPIILFSSRADLGDMVEPLINPLGYKLLVIDSMEYELRNDGLSNTRQYAEPISGSGGIVVEKVSRLRPLLLLFDIESEQIKWERWIRVLSSVPATKRIPIISIGKKSSIDLLRKSEQIGASISITHEDLNYQLPALITKYVLEFVEIDYSYPCSQQLLANAIIGLEAFNDGRYYDAHEYLEYAWMDDHSKGRDLYRALLQIAVAYYQITRGNYRGAVKMFWRVRQWIEPLPETCRGVDVHKLREDTSSVYKEIIRLGHQRIHEFDTKSLQPIKYEV